MLKHFLIVSWRNIVKNKGLSLINIIGLAVGITTCMFIALYINFETSFDNFHENGNRIYRLLLEMKRTNSTTVGVHSSPVMAEDIARVVPEVDAATRMTFAMGDLVVGNNTVPSGMLAIADSSIFSIFSFSLTDGDKESALSKPFSIVLTQSLSKMLFGNKSPIGEVLSLHAKTYTITGIIEDLPQNTMLNFNGLISFSSLYHDQSQGVMNAWDGNFSYYTYIMLKPDADCKEAEVKMNKLADEKVNPKFAAFDANLKFKLQPLRDVRLFNNTTYEPQGTAMRTYAFGAVAIFILFIAGFNFVNLTTALGSKRAKEVGLKKTVGCSKRQIRIHFLMEAVFTLLVALMISLLLVELLLPHFNSLLGLRLSLYASDSIWIIYSLPLFVVVFSLLAGAYPAIFLSNYQPLNAIKSQNGQRNGKRIVRNTLVVIQFVASSLLIIATATIYLQLEYIKNSDKGIDIEGVVTARIKTTNSWNDAELLKRELEKLPEVERIGLSDALIGSNFTQNGYSLEGVADQVLARAIGVDYDYILTMGMQMKAGRNFSRDFSTDSCAIIVNETLVRIAGWDNPIGKKINREKDFTVIGVVKDYNYTTLHKAIEPVVMFLPFGLAKRMFEPFISIKLNPSKLASALPRINEVWQKVLPSVPANTRYLASIVQSKYKAEENFARLFTFFTLFAILISCMGLLGLTSFGLENRKKEIGIKKVLGATIKSITTLFILDFTRWTIIGTLLSWPIAYLFIKNWLQNYAYSIAMPYYVFILATLLIYIIATATIITQTVRAAKCNPVDILRND